MAPGLFQFRSQFESLVLAHSIRAGTAAKLARSLPQDVTSFAVGTLLSACLGRRSRREPVRSLPAGWSREGGRRPRAEIPQALLSTTRPRKPPPKAARALARAPVPLHGPFLSRIVRPFEPARIAASALDCSCSHLKCPLRNMKPWLRPAVSCPRRFGICACGEWC